MNEAVLIGLVRSKYGIKLEVEPELDMNEAVLIGLVRSKY